MVHVKTSQVEIVFVPKKWEVREVATCDARGTGIIYARVFQELPDPERLRRRHGPAQWP